MKIKIIVAFALFIITFLIGSIFLINFIKNPIFLYLYFLFSLFLLIAIGMSLKKAYPKSLKLLFLIVLAVLIAISLTLFGSSVKTYYDKNNEMNNNLGPNFQIANMEKANEYYATYVDFLSGEILKIQQANLDLQLEINNLTAQKNAPQINDVPQDIPPIIIYRDEEEEEEDD